MSFLDTGDGAVGAGNDFSTTLDSLQSKTTSLGVSANSFASAMTRAFTQATTGGKQLDTVLQSLALRLSSLAVAQAFKPVASGIVSGIGNLGSLLANAIGGTASVTAQLGAVKPFAVGGVIGTPTYFPLAAGGLGLAGEAGPEAIMPLSRGPDGSLGVAMAGPAAGANVTVQIATPDVSSFRRSEAYVTGQIARAVARGQRNM
jgi:phage-related minor tail protein